MQNRYKIFMNENEGQNITEEQQTTQAEAENAVVVPMVSGVTLPESLSEEELRATVSVEAPLPQDAPQSVIDSIATETSEDDFDSVEGKVLAIGRLSVPLPHVTINAFYDKKWLKRRVKIGIVAYVFLVIFPVFFWANGSRSAFNALELQRGVTNTRYVAPLVAIDVAEKKFYENGVYMGFQLERDPLYGLYVLETIAGEIGVVYRHPSYSKNTRNIEDGIGIQLASTIEGSYADIAAFMYEVQKARPMFHVTSLSLSALSKERADSYAATITYTVAIKPPLDVHLATVQQKIESETAITYPPVQIDKVLERMDALRSVLYQGLGDSSFGKVNLFNS